MTGESWAMLSQKLGYDTSVHADEDPRTWPEAFARVYQDWYDEAVRDPSVPCLQTVFDDPTPEMLPEGHYTTMTPELKALFARLPVAQKKYPLWLEEVRAIHERNGH